MKQPLDRVALLETKFAAKVIMTWLHAVLLK